MTTNVPAPTLGANGFIAPDESAILAGVQADQQAAFGGDLNPALTTPQGQLAQSLAAIIGDANDQFLALANGVDPAFASGRLQDAIGRIYFITRNPAQSTVVTATCTGLAGTVIPVGAKAQDQGGNIYLCTQEGTIGGGGSIDLTFACATTGPIACPIGYLSKVYLAIPGWDSITNAAAGVVGNDVESRADFERRRQLSVALNAQGSLPSILAAVLNVPGVLDAYATENSSGTTTGATFTASISGAVMTVTGSPVGTIAVGQMVFGGSVAVGTVITSLGTGTGGAGTYNVNISQTVSSTSLAAAPGGIAMTAHSIFVSVYGGDQNDIAQAIWTKKAPGADYVGNTTVSVQDTNGYQPPYPTYNVTFYIPTPTAIKFAVSMQTSAALPSDAATQVKNAIIAAFNGADGGPKARIGSYIFASRFYAGIASLGSWALIYSIQLGVSSANQVSLLMPVTRIPTIAASDIAVSFS